MEAKIGKSGVRFEFELTTTTDTKISMDMEKQEKIIREFFSKIEEKQEQSPKELPTRSGEKYRFGWRMKGDQG